MYRNNYRHLIHHTEFSQEFTDRQWFDGQEFLRERMKGELARYISTLINDEHIHKKETSEPIGPSGLRLYRSTLKTDFILLSPRRFYSILDEVAEDAYERGVANGSPDRNGTGET